MTKEELLSVFKWLEANMNKNKLLYFKLTDTNQIGAYFKSDNHHFADLYIDKILECIKEENETNRRN